MLGMVLTSFPRVTHASRSTLLLFVAATEQSKELYCRSPKLANPDMTKNDSLLTNDMSHRTPL